MADNVSWETAFYLTSALFPAMTKNAVNMREGLSLTMTPPSVVVTVHGPPEQMRGLDEFTVQISVDLAGLWTGRYNLPVTVQQHRTREVTHIDPAVVEVVLR